MIALDQIEALLTRHYFDAPPHAIQPLTGGEENLNYRVSVGRTDYVLRVYSPIHSTTGPRRPADIDFELDFMDHARRHGIPTPEVIPTRAGARRVTLMAGGQARSAVLFEYLAGQPAAAYNAANARSVAQTLAKLRQASASFRCGRIRPWPGDIAAVSLEYYQKHRRVEGPHAQVLDRLFQAASTGYHRLNHAALPRGVVHGDIKLGNLLFDGDQVMAVLDFDDYRESCLIEDLTRALMHDLDSPTRNAIRAGVYPVFLTALTCAGALTPAEQEALPIFLRARFLYDVTVYLENGLSALVTALFEDQQVLKILLNDF